MRRPCMSKKWGRGPADCECRADCESTKCGTIRLIFNNCERNSDAVPARAEEFTLEAPLHEQEAGQGPRGLRMQGGLLFSIQDFRDLAVAVQNERSVSGGERLCQRVKAADIVVKLRLVL